MNYVIRFGKRLYLSKGAEYVNNMTDLNIRVFKAKDRKLALNIAKDMEGELVPFEPKKVRKKQTSQRYQFTNYELDNLVVLKKDNDYYTNKMELTNKLRNNSVLKLTVEQAGNVFRQYPNYDMTVAQLRTEVENKKPKQSNNKNEYYVVETRHQHFLTNDYKEVERFKRSNVKKYDLEFGKSLAYADAEKYGGKVKKVIRGRIIKKKFYRKKFLRGRARLIK
ncbi:hypothetical protein [Staphylococcus equorum]|uniref:Uncharacterized protein n=1 Tax=Staphylococcus equorum TaxID=246432 RepID=A0AAP7IFX3_9STAP|nr:hypothetical protein [Staphylococcus equorum]OEK58837.1 hypothetical protein ASS94_01400 [Staphylococcus equorum]